jgi:secondary thiamine-phosphate synthase enzyme
MRQVHHSLEVATVGRSLHDFTGEVVRWLKLIDARNGLLTLFLQHTSASLVIQENADPAVQRDLERFFKKLVKDGDPQFEHDAEGPDDMPAHIRATLMQTQLSIPIRDARLVLGTWQGLYVYEHRTSGNRRNIALHFLGD